MSTPSPVASPPPNLMARDLRFAFQKRDVLRGVTLSVGPGEVVSLLGANGSGKTTLLRLLLGLLQPLAGEVSLGGRALRGYPRRELAQHLAYVPQTHVSPFPYTVRDIVLLGRLPHRGITRVPSREDRAVVEEILARLGLGGLADRCYSEVSGGERQLALIARALAQGARFLVLDEPASGLDYGNQIRFLEHLRALADQGYAIIKSTHQPEHALLASTRVALLHGGVILRDGPPRDVVTPDALRTLYGVQMMAFHSPDGRATAFHPAGRADPGEPA